MIGLTFVLTGPLRPTRFKPTTSPIASLTPVTQTPNPFGLNTMTGHSHQDFADSYAVSGNGRSTMTLFGNNQVAYFFAPNEGYILQRDDQLAMYGTFKPQSGGPFNTAAITGAFLANSRLPINEDSENDSGITTFDGGGALILDQHWGLWNQAGARREAACSSCPGCDRTYRPSRSHP